MFLDVLVTSISLFDAVVTAHVVVVGFPTVFGDVEIVSVAVAALDSDAEFVVRSSLC